MNEIPNGPDRTATAHDLVLGIVDAFGFSQYEAESYLSQACRALEEWVGFRRFAPIKSQLPEELRGFLTQEFPVRIVQFLKQEIAAGESGSPFN